MGAGAAGGFGGVLGLAAIELEELVSQGSATVDGKDAIGHAVNTKVGNRLGASVASAKLSTRDDSNGLEDVWGLLVSNC